eukprot:Plantae.Rhodophyta-Hildenbrandia_rubra.ctg11063.p1 GENE.Plantae.Rhodophyta-Hildenbrandia_rubra.ctg11063~~Plantae.Rhodophyta-Hildenbrandia_rubra.ctg11063.p1  ORF type:complete len:526 (+),score=112.48 Plantae.Rhodophyta-Hildenbrandia_rubra.ctg11063:566-2143(+)
MATVVDDPPATSIWDRMPAPPETPESPPMNKATETGEDWGSLGGVSGVENGVLLSLDGECSSSEGEGKMRNVGEGRRLSSESGSGSRGGSVVGVVRGERVSPMAHFVSLENIARLYEEMKRERDLLVEENEEVFEERVEVVGSLKRVEGKLMELLEEKAGLEGRLDLLGRKSEENRKKMAMIDDKVANIANESKKFEAIVRDLKGDGEEEGKDLDFPESPKSEQKLTMAFRESEACERTMYGHTGHVLGLDVDEETNVIISASSDHSIRTWDMTTGRRIDTLYGHAGWVHAVAFSKTGQRAVSASGDKTVKLWDLGTSRGRGCCLTTLDGHDAGVTSVQIDEDNILVSGSLDKTLRRYDLNSGSGSAGASGTVIPGHESGVYCLQFWRHGLASGGGDSLVRMHDLRTGLCHRTLAGHTDGAVRTLQFDEKRLVSGGTDCVLRFWDLRTGGCTAAIETNARINALQFDDTRLVVACADRLVKVYDLQSMKLVEEHGGHLGPILSLAGCSNAFCTGSSDQTLKVWKL